MIVALKLLIVVVWVGAGVSKFGQHFSNVVPPMVSNSPVHAVEGDQAAALPRLPARPAAVRRAADLMAHVGGTLVEIVTPLVLLFSTNHA